MSRILGYGVMVTLQILVLPCLVRVRVAQHKRRDAMRLFSVFVLGYPDSNQERQEIPPFSLLRKRAHSIRLAALRDRGLARRLARSNTLYLRCDCGFQLQEWYGTMEVSNTINYPFLE